MKKMIAGFSIRFLIVRVMPAAAAPAIARAVGGGGYLYTEAAIRLPLMSMHREM